MGAGGAEVVVEGCPGGSVAQGTGAPLGDMLTKELKDQDRRGFPPQGARVEGVSVLIREKQWNKRSRSTFGKEDQA